MILPRLAVLLFLAAAPAWAAEAPSLAWPVDCRPGETCWVMNYPDTDPGPGVRDFRCRPRSYDGHDGTDIAISDRKTMTQGVPVLAATDGEVLRVRDGEADGAYLDGAKVGGKECGNAVLMRLEDGWQARYCHMRNGSVAVRPGQKVKAGERLGMVGLSGLTEFPHLHLDLQHDGRKIDPFTGAGLAAGCGKPPQPLWARSPGYDAGALYAAGFADRVPTAKAVKTDASSPETMARSAPALVLWAAALGVARGDRLHLTLAGPDGAVVVRRDLTLERDQAWRMEAVGKRTPKGGWAPGTYRGETRLERSGRPPETRTVTIEIR